MNKHYYAILPNSDAYKVDWCTEISDTEVSRVPAPSDWNHGIVFGCMDTLEKCIENVHEYQKIHGTNYDCIVYKRKSKDEPYTFVLDYILTAH